MIKLKTSLRNTSFLIDMTPLVDVTFLMLIFFMVTSDILPLKSLNIQNPTLNCNATALTTQLLVVMDAENVIYLGSRKEIVDLASLKASLQNEIQHLKQRQPGIEPTVVLSIDRQVQYGAVLRLLATAQECSSRIRLVFKPEEESSLRSL